MVVVDFLHWARLCGNFAGAVLTELWGGLCLVFGPVDLGPKMSNMWPPQRWVAQISTACRLFAVAVFDECQESVEHLMVGLGGAHGSCHRDGEEE